MAPSFTGLSVATRVALPRQIRPFLKQWWLPLLSIVILCVMMSLTGERVAPHERTPLEWVAHYLGHGINSVWVGISLILLVVPSLVTQFVRKHPDVWAWRALDAIILDYFVVDALGKHLIVGLVRPGPGHKPGFPSGHTTMAFLMAWLIWQRYPKLGPLWFAIATLISWSRIQSHAHYPYQVFAGALFGCGLAALIISREAGVILPRVFLCDGRMHVRLKASLEAS